MSRLTGQTGGARVVRAPPRRPRGGARLARSLAGQDWDLEIEKAVESADVVIVCLSKRSLTKEGYVQKEIRKVLDIALEKPEDTIYIVPLRLDDCELPRRLRSWHDVDYFPPAQREHAYERLLRSLSARLAQLQPPVGNHPPGHSDPVEKPNRILEEKKPVSKAGMTRSGDVDTGTSILLAIYFAIAALDSLLGVSAILAGMTL